jgi:serine/threonine protein kinase
MQDACNDSGETSSVLLTVSGRDRTKCEKRAVRAVYSADIPDMLGRTISHYRITGKLGTGGMGVVYEAEDTRLPRKVALKFLPDELADDSDAVRRFRREAETIATLSHSHICTIYDIDEHDGRIFIAMECLDGVNLKTYMSRNTLTTARIADLGLQIASALGAAHAKGIVHRDIKPGNLMVSETGTVKVLDFGLARRFKTADTDELGPEGSTMPGRPVGTANYMAPERILQLPLDPRSDLFSLGVVMYEMATGRLPFAGASPSETVSNVLDKDPDPLSTLAPHHKPLEPVVHRLLAKRVSERYRSTADLTTALEPLATPPPTLGERFRRLLRRS